MGGIYANDVSVLCGNWLCGGPLGLPAGSSASRRSRYTFPVTGTAVEIFERFGRAHPLRLHFVYARPSLSTLSTVTNVFPRSLRSSDLSIELL
jgi:hypothetical protein